MRAGDRVRLIGIPDDAQADEFLKTRSLFEECLEREFVIAAVESVPGAKRKLARLEVGHDFDGGERHTIRVEARYLRSVRPGSEHLD